MDKLTMAHEYALKLMGRSSITIDEAVRLSFDLAEAMQAEAEKRESKERPEVLCEVDWGQAPEDAVAFLKLSDWDVPAWIDEHGIQIEDAPSFGFTGTHIVERPYGF